MNSIMKVITAILVLILITAGYVTANDLPSDDPRSEKLLITQIHGDVGYVKFQQLIFDFEVGLIEGTDWGQLQIKPKRFLREVNSCNGYVNVFITGADGRLSWVVDNMFVHEPANKRNDKCEQKDQEEREEFFLMDPFVDDHSKINPKIITRNMLVSKFLDLRPGENSLGRIDNIDAIVLFSQGPLLNADEIYEYVARNFLLESYKVKQFLNNSEGDLSGMHVRGLRNSSNAVVTPPEERSPTYLIGQPPAPVRTKPKALFTQSFYPLGYFQEAYPNVNSGINACVPVSHANALAYLEHRYNFNPNIWNLPDWHVRGVGRIVNQGDISFYEPFPDWSISANVDFFTRRSGVFDLDTGRGSNLCQSFRGLLGYLALVSSNAPTMQVRHQGSGNTVIGDNATCDLGYIDLGGLQSVREGVAPTWEWMRDQIIAGRSVVMGYGRYNEDGGWSSGHSVRIYGVSFLNGKKYIHWLDDGTQGNNFEGLRTLTFEVTDLHSPGAANVPNGFLELDGMVSRQIVIAVSVEVAPKYIFP